MFGYPGIGEAREWGHLSLWADSLFCSQGFFLLLAVWVCVSPGGWWASAAGCRSGLVPGLVPTEVSPAQSRVTSRGERSIWLWLHSCSRMASVLVPGLFQSASFSWLHICPSHAHSHTQSTLAYAETARSLSLKCCLHFSCVQLPPLPFQLYQAPLEVELS